MHDEENKKWLIEALSDNYEANAPETQNGEPIKNTIDDYYSEPIKDGFAENNDDDNDNDDHDLKFNDITAEFDKDDSYDYDNDDKEDDEDDDDDDDDVDDDDDDVDDDDDDDDDDDVDDVDDVDEAINDSLKKRNNIEVIKGGSSIVKITGDMIVQPGVYNNALKVFFPSFKKNEFNQEHVFTIRVNCIPIEHTCPSLVKISAEMLVQ